MTLKFSWPWVVVVSIICLNTILPAIASPEEGNGHRKQKTGSRLFYRGHPLEPLSAGEIETTTSIIKRYVGSDIYKFSYITLKEPEKALLLPYFLNNKRPPVNRIPRKSFVELLSKTVNRAIEVVVNLDNKRVESWDKLPVGFTTIYTPEESRFAEEICKMDPDVIEKCREVGWTNMSLVTTSAWPTRYLEDKPPHYKDKRLMRMYFFGKNFFEDSQYAHPFGFGAVVDVLNKSVVEVYDLPTHDGPDNTEKATVPTATANFDPDLRDPNSYRKDLHPVHVSQRGRGYSISGMEIKWQKFKMRIGFNGREGVLLYNINYNDNGRVRPLFYRMSLVDVYTTYGDSREPYHWKVVSDEGELGIGLNLNSLRQDIDCIGEVRYFTVYINDEAGRAVKIPRAICLFEEDDGILWKHTDFRTGKSVLVRNQRLALMTIATLGNYEFIFTWRFYLDGTIDFNVKLSGILNVNLLAVNATPIGHGQIVLSQVNAQYHQHYFSLRLDAEIDGTNNTVSTYDVVPGPGETGSQYNPYGQAFTTQNTVLTTAAEGRTNNAPEKSRVWWISNPNEMHPFSGEPVSWRLIPHPTPTVLIRKNSPLHARVKWLDYNTWVLPYKEDQLFPEGYYLNKSGLSQWVKEDPQANIVNTDIVLWHNFGVTHIPRVEDYPVMPVEQFSVFLKPTNFFTENPALDVPPLTYVTQ